MSQQHNPSGVPTDTDRWFVQIKEQIVGPLPTAKVLERLLKDELSVTHRISNDRTTWAAICNTPFFEELIEYRIRLYSGEQNLGPMYPGGDTSQFEISQVFGLHGATDGISEQLDQARQLEELTANIQKLNQLRKEIQLKKKSIIIEDPDDQTASLHPDDQDVFVPAAPKKKKGFEFKNLFKGNMRGRRPMIGVAVLIALGLIATQVYSHFEQQKKMAEDRDNLRQALQAQAAGDYAKAIATFRNVEAAQQPGQKLATSRELIKIAEAHISGKEPQMAQRILAQAATMEISNSERARIHTLKASIASQRGDLAAAASELEESLKSAEDFATLHNLGILLLKLRKPLQAETFLLKAIALADKTPGSDTSPTILAIFEVAASLEKNAPLKPRLESVARLLETNLVTTTSLRDEQHLALAVVRYLLQQPDAFRLAAIELIDASKNEDESPRKANLDYDLANWSLLYKHCTAIYNKPTSPDFGASFYASCLRRSHGAQGALPFAKYALALRPTDAMYIGQTADLLIDLKQFEEAQKILVVNGRVVSASKLGILSLQRLQKRAQQDEQTRVPAAAPSPAAP